MTNTQIVREVEELLQPILLRAELELWDVEFVQEGGSWYLRIFIDKPAGINHEDCVLVSESIDPLLDEKVPVGRPYTLEVSSPGLERPLKKPADFARYLGELITVTTFSAVAGRKKFTARLTGVNPDGVLVELEGRETALAYPQIASARLKVTF